LEVKDIPWKNVNGGKATKHFLAKPCAPQSRSQDGPIKGPNEEGGVKAVLNKTGEGPAT